MIKASQVIVLAEDIRQQSFIRNYLLKSRGYLRHSIRNLPLPAGRGSGERWVRNNYAKEVKALRVRQARTALILAIDADAGSVEDRLQQLARALANAGLSPRADNEVIVLLIPKRNIETWILSLNGESVDEATDYKDRAGIDEGIPGAAAELFEWSRANAVVPANCVQSLHFAIPEVKRLG